MSSEAINVEKSDVDLHVYLQAENAQLRIDMQLQSDRFMSTIAELREENQILIRRLYGNRTERSNTSETQLAFDDLLKAEAALQKALDEARKAAEEISKPPGEGQAESGDDGSGSDNNEKKTPRGRRDLSQSSLPRVEVEIDDRSFEGKHPRSGFDISYQLMKKRSAYVVLVKKTVKYDVTTPQGTSTLSAQQPPSLFDRALLHTSTAADIIVRKFSRGEPLYRQEKHVVDADSAIDRGTMCRYVEQAGNTFGATVVHAMWQDGIKNAGVISTDATGAAIQPEKGSGGKQACGKGHFFTAVVDDSAVLFRYVAKHTQESVKMLFGEFRGYLQADAHHVYNVLERPPPSLNAALWPEDARSENARIKLVGCWAHTRRYYFEAAICRHAVGVQGLLRIQAIYAIDQAIMKLPRNQRTQLRQERVRPLMEAFFGWAKQAQNEAPRSRSAKAIGYTLNQQSELLAVLDNPDVPLDNTRSERALRTIVVGRKNWMFYGSDCHAEAAAAIFSLLATCRLHRIEPYQYLDELMRVLPFWPKHRHLELAPQNWVRTRARLVAAELDKPISWITVPAELPAEVGAPAEISA